MFQSATYPSLIYTVAFTISFGCWLVFEMWVFFRDRGKKMKDTRRGGMGVILGIVIGITLGLNMPNIAPQFDIRDPFAVAFVFGILLMWAGILFRFWAIQTLGKFFSTRLVIQEGHELITTGPYKYLRNPSYTGALITFTGFGFGVGNWLSIAVLLVAVLITYAWRIRVEERMLLEQFGQAFEDYKKGTWALIPFVW
jgi:protein-S-isoprenylcysteine O-methyltransferase Ste14